MNTKPFLSIVIPTLNEEENIPKLLQDIRKNTYRDYEIIVADSGSSDDTAAIVKRMKKVIFVRAGKGAATARNAGAKKARGAFILFLDADQRIPRTFIARSLKEVLMRKMDIGSFYGKPSGRRTIDRAFWFVVNNVLFRPLQYIYPAGSTGSGLIIKRSIHRAIKGFDEQIEVIHDHDYVRRASKKGRFRMLNSQKAMFNMRRFEDEGRLRVYIKYVLLIVYHVLHLKGTPVQYQFGKHRNT